MKILVWMITNPPISQNWKINKSWWVFETFVATLALGSRPRQRESQGCGPRGSPGVKAKRKPGNQGKRKPGSHITYSWECCMREWTLTLPRQLPLWEVESRWTPEISESDCKGQTSMDYDFLYIIGKILKRRCLKWARIAHSDICNTSYGQKKGRESNCQFDSRPQRVGNRPLPDVRFRSATRRWKALDESYNFALDRITIEGLLAKLWGSKVSGVPFGAISGLPFESPEKNRHLDVGSVESHRVYYKGGRWWLPPGPGRGESCLSVLPVARPNTKSAPTLH